MIFRRSALAAAVVCAVAAAFAPPTHALTITRAFSGLWQESAPANRGFSAEVVHTDHGNTLMAYWFTKDASGRPVWLIGEGAIVGNHAVLDAVVAASTSASSTVRPWGTLTVSFDDCSHGSVQMNPTDARQPAGRTSLTRLSDDSSASCTGGISDDRVASHDDRIVQFFSNSGVVPAANGRARFEERSDRTDFNVEVEDLPAGQYSLRVAGVERGTLDVAARSGGNQGELEFRSPAEPGHLLLDFDPREQTVEVAQGSTIFLAMAFGSGAGGGGNGGGDDAHGTPATRYVLDVEPAHDGPEMKAELEVRGTRSDFSVELEHVPVGAYVLAVGGEERAKIDVTAVAGGNEGEVEFRDPPEPGHLDLDFDPRGQNVQILQDGAVLLSGTFPTVASNGDGNDGNNGGGNDDPPGDDNGGHGGGNDDPPGDDNGGHGGGNDDPPGDDNGGHGGGNDAPPGDDHGGGGHGDHGH